ncbi:MAG: hypothetical protein ACYC6H_11250 [Bellilinea sp.]
MILSLPGVEGAREPLGPAEKQGYGDYGLNFMLLKNEHLRGEIADPFLKMLI